jgi:mannose-6-phosphate isomerase class I
LLDADQKLSLQVHPPSSIAAQLGGEPKTEMWFIAHAEPGAELYVGLRRGVTRALFERKIADGTVADCFHRLAVQRGDVMFLPSGRVHALGAGLVIFEIQQNSDTTYRVFDWNRVGLDGKPRDLHIEQSLACIDFNDFEPGLVQSEWQTFPGLRRKTLVRSDLFQADLVGLPPRDRVRDRHGLLPRPGQEPGDGPRNRRCMGDGVPARAPPAAGAWACGSTDSYVDHYEYAIAGTPCEPVVCSKSLVHFPENVIALFPGDNDLKPI